MVKNGEKVIRTFNKLSDAWSFKLSLSKVNGEISEDTKRAVQPPRSTAQNLNTHQQRGIEALL